LLNRPIAGESPLRVWRKHRGLKLKDMADRAGIGSADLSALETGSRQGNPRIWRALALALDASVGDILPQGVADGL